MFKTVNKLIDNGLEAVSKAVSITIVVKDSSVIINEGNTLGDDYKITIPFDSMNQVWLTKDLREEFDCIMIDRFKSDKSICHYSAVKPENGIKVVNKILGVIVSSELSEVSFNKHLNKLIKAKSKKEEYKALKKAAAKGAE